jgi:hypothetical protein
MGANWVCGERRSGRTAGRLGAGAPGGPWPRSGAQDVRSALEALLAHVGGSPATRSGVLLQSARERLAADPRPAEELAAGLGLSPGAARARLIRAAGTPLAVGAGPVAGGAGSLAVLLAHWTLAPLDLLARIEAALAHGQAVLVLGHERAPAALDALGEALAHTAPGAPVALLHGAGREALAAACAPSGASAPEGLWDGPAPPGVQPPRPRLRRARLRAGLDPGRAARLVRRAAFGLARTLGGQAHGALGLLEVHRREYADFVAALLAQLREEAGRAGPRSPYPAARDAQLLGARRRRLALALEEGATLVHGTAGGSAEPVRGARSGGAQPARLGPALLVNVPRGCAAAAEREPLGTLLLVRSGRAWK